MRMITKHNAIVLGAAIIISALILFFFRIEKNSHKSPEQVSYKIFFDSTGWGYDITSNGKIFIHQIYVPTLPFEKGFAKKEYADKAARLVTEKLKENKSPTLTQQELSQISPLDKLVYEPISYR